MATFIQLGDQGREKTPLCFREDLRQRRPRAVTEFGATLDAFGLAQSLASRLFQVSPRHIRRWRSGDRRLPHAVGIVCNLLVMGAVTIEQVEAAAVPASARTHGSTPPEPLAPIESAPEPSVLTCAKTASFAAPGPSIAEKVYALDGCRYPHGNLEHPEGFYFCSAPIARGSYCQRHLNLVYLPRGSGHGVRGFVVHGRHGRPPIPGAPGASRPPKLPFDCAGDLPSSAPPLA